jgi:hypothetical protein
MACQDSGAVNEKISRRSLYIMIMAPIITVGMIDATQVKAHRSAAGEQKQARIWQALRVSEMTISLFKS